jgi:2-(1,2-epoxy-1,2-dihydrophenyl)acetyl-CoA isomerase
MSDDVLYEDSGGVAGITLNRPDKLNSATSEMLRDLLGALRQADADDDVRSVLLTGAGRAFCAGQDLSDPAVAGTDVDLGALLQERWNPVILAIRQMPKPVVVAVNGVAAGAGANLALAGDIVIAARSARFIQSFSKVGLMPDSGGTWVLPRLVGVARATGLSITGDPLGAEDAAAWGLIWAVVDDDALGGEAAAMATALAAGPTGAYAAIKHAINSSASNTLDDQLDLERDLQRELGRSHDHREGAAAFTEKRDPNFSGQ